MLLLADSHLQRDQGHPSSSWTKSVPHDVTGLPVHSIKSCTSSNFLRHKKLSHPSSEGFPSACKEDYLIMSQRVCTQLTVGNLYSRSLSCSLLFQVESRGSQMSSCTSLVLFNYPAIRPARLSSWCWPTHSAATWIWQHQLSSLPQELVKTCSAATPENAREAVFPGPEKLNHTGREKFRVSEGLGHCMQHSRTAIVCCLALPQLFAELALLKGWSLMVAHH